MNIRSVGVNLGRVAVAFVAAAAVSALTLFVDFTIWPDPGFDNTVAIEGAIYATLLMAVPGAFAAPSFRDSDGGEVLGPIAYISLAGGAMAAAFSGLLWSFAQNRDVNLNWDFFPIAAFNLGALMTFAVWLLVACLPPR